MTKLSKIMDEFYWRILKCQKREDRVGISNCCGVLYCSVPNRMVGVYIY